MDKLLNLLLANHWIQPGKTFAPSDTYLWKIMEKLNWEIEITIWFMIYIYSHILSQLYNLNMVMEYCDSDSWQKEIDIDIDINCCKVNLYFLSIFVWRVPLRLPAGGSRVSLNPPSALTLALYLTRATAPMWGCRQLVIRPLSAVTRNNLLGINCYLQI